MLRGSLRAKVTSVQEREEEERREARRIKGRESYARRRQASLLADKDRGVGRDSWVEEEQQTNEKGSEVEPTVGDDIWYAAGAEEEEEEEARETAPVAMRPKRKSSGHRLMDPTPPKKQKVEEDSTSAAVVSKFTEGSMRNRASAVPRMDLIGLEVDTTTGGAAGGGSGRASIDDEASQAGGAGLFGLGALGTAAGALNPFRFANRIRAAWDKQKAEYMAHERKKRLLAERKRKGEEAYERFMRQRNLLREAEMDDMDIDGVNGEVAPSTGRNSEESPQARAPPVGPIQNETPIRSDTSELYSPEAYTTFRGQEGSEGVRVKGHTRYGSTFSDGSAASSSASKGGDRGNTSGHLRGLSRSSMRMLSPPPALTEGLNEVKTLVKKKSKIFVSTLTGKDDSIPKNGPTKREIKKQERLRNKVSNLEEQLEKAKKELESITKGTNCPPVPKIPQPVQKARPSSTGVKHELRPTNGDADYQPDDTDDEGDDTEVDEFSQSFTAAPLSPVVNSSFGGSFNATALAGMNIVGSFSEEQAHPPVVGKRTSSRRSGLRALPKRASTSVLPSVTKVKGSRNSPPPPPTSGGGVVPPVPKLSRRSSGL